jgi:hypothetical protein
VNPAEQQQRRTVGEALHARLDNVETVIEALAQRQIDAIAMMRAMVGEERAVRTKREYQQREYVDGADTRNERLIGAVIETTTNCAERFNSVIHGGFWTRLVWLLRGTVPYCVARDRLHASVAENAVAQGGFSQSIQALELSAESARQGIQAAMSETEGGE